MSVSKGGPGQARWLLYVLGGCVLAVAGCTGEADQPETGTLPLVSASVPGALTTVPDDAGVASGWDISIPVTGVVDDDAAGEAFAVVVAAYEAYNTGDVEAWADARQPGSYFSSSEARDTDRSEMVEAVGALHASGSRIDVTGCVSHGLGDWPGIADRGVASGYRFRCETTSANVVLLAGGIELAATFEWVVADGDVVAVKSEEDPEHWHQVLRFYEEFQSWLRRNRPDAYSQMSFVDFLPAAESVPAALEYVGVFVDASPDWPLLPEPEPELSGIVDGVEVYNADPTQEALVEWALARFDAAGLPRPSVTRLEFPSTESCSHYLAGRTAHSTDTVEIEVCVTSDDISQSARAARHTILHELGHAWEIEHVTDRSRQAFLEHWGLDHWSGADIWEENGNEHAAEVLAWALMDDLVLPRIPNATCARLAEAFEVLTPTTAALRQDDCTDEGVHYSGSG